MTAGPTRVLAVDLGGTKINAAVVVFEEGAAAPSLCQVATTATPARDGAKAVLAASLAVAREALSLAGDDEETLKAIGIASAGVIDTARGLVTAATDALQGWPGTNLASVFRAEFGAHTRVLNDVHAHGLGEAMFGAGKDRDSLLLVAVGTGIGGAFVTHGEVLTGARRRWPHRARAYRGDSRCRRTRVHMWEARTPRRVCVWSRHRGRAHEARNPRSFHTRSRGSRERRFDNRSRNTHGRGPSHGPRNWRPTQCR